MRLIPVRLLVSALVIGCVATFGFPAAGAIISDVIFAIDAEGPGGTTSSFEVPISSGNIDGDTLTWALDQPVSLMDATGAEIGVLEMANVMYVADPVVVLNFLVSSGGGGNFTVTSANLSFTGLSGAMGRASAAITVTDFGGGASLGGNFPNNDTYRAFYNDPGNVAATGTTFATLAPGISSSPFSSATSNEGFPDNTGGLSSTDENGASLGTVGSMSSQWQFSVSANDSASGTSTFFIIPEPSSGLLLWGLMAVWGFTRRR